MEIQPFNYQASILVDLDEIIDKGGINLDDCEDDILDKVEDWLSMNTDEAADDEYFVDEVQTAVMTRIEELRLRQGIDE